MWYNNIIEREDFNDTYEQRLGNFLSEITKSVDSQYSEAADILRQNIFFDSTFRKERLAMVNLTPEEVLLLCTHFHLGETREVIYKSILAYPNEASITVSVDDETQETIAKLGFRTSIGGESEVDGRSAWVYLTYPILPRFLKAFESEEDFVNSNPALDSPLFTPMTRNYTTKNPQEALNALISGPIESMYDRPLNAPEGSMGESRRFLRQVTSFLSNLGRFTYIRMYPTDEQRERMGNKVLEIARKKRQTKYGKAFAGGEMS